MKTKCCSKCGEKKLLDSFFNSKSNKTGKQSWCKECHTKRRKDDYWKNVDKVRNRHRLRKYGISLDQYKEMLKQQNEKCAICQSTKVGRRKCRCFITDHNHDTNQVRGLLCHNCNVLLGAAKDNSNILRKAAAYLDVYSKVSEG